MAMLRPLEAAFESNFLVPEASLAVLLFLGLGTLVWIWMLIDALVRPASAWRAADRSQVAWILVLVLLSWIGALLYLVIARPALRQAAAPTGGR